MNCVCLKRGDGTPLFVVTTMMYDVFLNATNTRLQPLPKGGALEVFVKQGDQVWVLDHDAVRMTYVC
jgi:hypothetical protein